MSPHSDATAAEPPHLRAFVDEDVVKAALEAAGAILVDASGAVFVGEMRDEREAAAARAIAEQGGNGDALFPVAVPVRLPKHLLGVVLGRDAEQAPLVTGVARMVERWAQTRAELQNVVGELVWRYEELSVLYDASETIASIMDLAEVSRRILEKAADMLDVDNASLMLIDGDTQELRIQDAIGLENAVVESMRLRMGEEISGWVAAEGKPLLIEDIEKHPLFKKVNQERYINRSLLSVPLKIKDRVIGVLNVNNKRSGAVFTSGDLKLLASLASLAAISIENAHTYQNAITDRLTRLYNYGYFREELGRKIQMARDEGCPISLVMFDIDHFKNFNDKNGHELANVALVRIANLALENSRQKGDRIPDLVARYGGEEFMIILYGVGVEGAVVTAERVRRSVERTVFNGGENQPGGRVTISVGLATCPDHVSDGDALVTCADKALYKAKKGGRNQVQVAEPS